MIRAEYKQYLLEFIAIQLSRRYENLKRLGIDKTVDIFINIMKQAIPEKFLRETIDSENFKEDLWLIQLYKYVKNNSLLGTDDFKDNSISKIIDSINYQMQVCFFIV